MLIITSQKYLKSAIEVLTFSVSKEERFKKRPLVQRLVLAPQLAIYNYLFTLCLSISILYFLKQVGVSITFYTDLSEEGLGNVFAPFVNVLPGVIFGIIHGIWYNYYMSILTAVIIGVSFGVISCINVYVFG